MDLERERTQVLRRDAEWAKLGSSGHDIDRILSCWTDDARVYPPDLPVVSGRAALRGYRCDPLAGRAAGLPVECQLGDATGSEGRVGHNSRSRGHRVAERTGWRMALRRGHLECGSCRSLEM
jgi:hypothetical protein